MISINSFAVDTQSAGEMTWKVYVYAKNTGLLIDKSKFQNLCSIVSNTYSSFCYEGYNASFITSFSLPELTCIFDFHNLNTKLARRAAHIGMGIELGAQYNETRDEIKISDNALFCKNKLLYYIVDGFGMGIVHKNSNEKYLTNTCAYFKKYGLEEHCLFGVGRGLFFHSNPVRFKTIEKNKSMLSGFKLIEKNGYVKAGYVFAIYNAGKENDHEKYKDFFGHVGYLSYEDRMVLATPKKTETLHRYNCMENILSHHLDCALSEQMQTGRN